MENKNERTPSIEVDGKPNEMAVIQSQNPFTVTLTEQILAVLERILHKASNKVWVQVSLSKEGISTIRFVREIPLSEREKPQASIPFYLRPSEKSVMFPNGPTNIPFTLFSPKSVDDCAEIVYRTLKAYLHPKSKVSWILSVNEGKLRFRVLKG